MQKPIIERQTITANQWQCAGNDFISLWHDGTWIFANDITLNEGCNIKFANRSDYSYITKCDFLDPVLVNSIKVEGNLAHSKFNGTSFLYADNIYFDTKLSIDKDTNISMSNFVYNSKDFAEDMQSFDLINYNMNNY
ncbi:MAG TPA: hypothetical protein P5052_00895 [Candidatus Paceibacterota bacterium]|nr:hypothetical protein [Candidatus Paceibacterota bacterium]